MVIAKDHLCIALERGTFVSNSLYLSWFDHRYRRAQLALGKGNEDLAREALKRRKSYAVSSPQPPPYPVPHLSSETVSEIKQLYVILRNFT